MKKIIFFILLALFTHFLTGQEEEIVPESVVSAFGEMFPQAEYILWTNLGHEGYQVEFSQEGLNRIARFDVEGDWVETKTFVDEMDLPEAVELEIQTRFPEMQIQSVIEIFMETGITFNILLDDDDDQLTAVFRDTGEFLFATDMYSDDIDIEFDDPEIDDPND